MKCPKCNGIGKILTFNYDLEKHEVIECPKCHGSGKKLMTEQEYLQTCNTEQLAEAIYECVMANSWSFSKDGIKRWLKQPHTFK